MNWAQYYLKWLSAATPIPIRIAEVIFFLLTLLVLGMQQLRPKWAPKMTKMSWLLPMVVLVVLFLISLAVSSCRLYLQQNQAMSDLKQQLDIARRQAYPPITTLMMEQYFRDKDIPLGEFGLVNTTLADKTFENCRIHGTIVLFLVKDVKITGCHLDGDQEASFIITSNKRIAGILAITKCTFINCTFRNISFIGNAELIAKIKAGFVFSKPMAEDKINVITK